MAPVTLVPDDISTERFSPAWWADVLLGAPLRVLLILVAAVLARYLVRKAIDRLVARTTTAAERLDQPEVAGGRRLLGSRAAAQLVLGDSPAYTERRVLRAQTMGSLVKSIATFVIYSVAALMALRELGFDVAPLIASAGIVGIALGFGAQNLVKDFLSGVFMLVEDQYGVGDVIDMGEASGVVEAVTLRVTQVRDVNGVLWYVRNGEVTRIGNMSHGWSRAVLDVGVAYGEDTTRVRQLLTETVRGLYEDPEWDELMLEEPEVWGVEALGADGMVIRVVLKTKPLQQWKVAREARERIKAAFDAHGVEIPLPQRTIWLRQESDDPIERATHLPADRHGSPPAANGAVGASRLEPDGPRRGEAARRPPAPEAPAGSGGTPGGSRG